MNGARPVGPHPDMLTIRAHHEAWVRPDYAVLSVRVEGSSLLRGDAAFRKAEEVRHLVEGLAAVGVPEDDVEVVDVRSHTESGLFSKSSSVTYDLRVRCRDIQRIPEALGVVTEARAATLQQVEWRYDQDVEREAGWLRACLRDAEHKAQAAAEALGVRITGVHELHEGIADGTGPSIHPRHLAQAQAKSRGGGGGGPIDLGISLASARRIVYAVTVSYRVGPRDGA